MIDVDFIPKVLENLIKFLKEIVPEVVSSYEDIHQFTPLEQKSIIQRELKPYQLSLEAFIENLIQTHGLDIKNYKEEDLCKFKRFLQALCEAV